MKDPKLIESSLQGLSKVAFDMYCAGAILTNKIKQTLVILLFQQDKYFILLQESIFEKQLSIACTLHIYITTSSLKIAQFTG